MKALDNKLVWRRRHYRVLRFLKKPVQFPQVIHTQPNHYTQGKTLDN